MPPETSRASLLKALAPVFRRHREEHENTCGQLCWCKNKTLDLARTNLATSPEANWAYLPPDQDKIQRYSTSPSVEAEEAHVEEDRKIWTAVAEFYEREARREERAQQSMKLHGIVDVRLKKEREKKLLEDQEWAAMVNAAINIFEPSAGEETVDKAEDDSDNAQPEESTTYSPRHADATTSECDGETDSSDSGSTSDSSSNSPDSDNTVSASLGMRPSTDTVTTSTALDTNGPGAEITLGYAPSQAPPRPRRPPRNEHGAPSGKLTEGSGAAGKPSKKSTTPTRTQPRRPNKRKYKD
ncbi:hypothetical protein K466DRAFT_599279 [Polyporus arcularius HHB13444]|uniref:Uncharacterized protein n=1 Tax=Polyporus arcularius HHB13444 TaxID=1314778 RepID=A0A5C3PEL0_9APHY|nr:hypothetical protein K466DRAFT_599279 [Polyporus arcularius HHB13444]